MSHDVPRGTMGDLNGSDRNGRFRPMAIKKEVWEKAKALYLSEVDWESIAEQLGVKKATLMNRASKEGLTRVKREINSISLNKKGSVIEQSIESLSKLMRSKLATDAVSTLERVDKYDISDIREENTREQVLSSLAKRSALVFGWNDQSENATVSINLLNALPDKVINVNDDKQIQ